MPKGRIVKRKVSEKINPMTKIRVMKIKDVENMIYNLHNCRAIDVI